MMKTILSHFSPRRWLFITVFLLGQSRLFSEKLEATSQTWSPTEVTSKESSKSAEGILQAENYASFQDLDSQDCLNTKRKKNLATINKEVFNIKVALTKMVVDEIIEDALAAESAATIVNKKVAVDKSIGPNSNLGSKPSGVKHSPTRLGSKGPAPKTQTLDSGIENLPRFHEVQAQTALADHKDHRDEAIGSKSNLAGKESGVQKSVTKLGSRNTTPKTESLDSGIENLPRFHEVQAQTALADHKDHRDEAIGPKSNLAGKESGVQKSVTKLGSRNTTPKTESLDSGIENLPRFNQVLTESKVADHQPAKEVKIQPESIGPSTEMGTRERGAQATVNKAGSRRTSPKNEALESGIANLPRFHEVTAEASLAEHQAIRNQPESIGAESNLAAAEEGLKNAGPAIGSRRSSPRTESLDSGVANLPQFHEVESEARLSAHQPPQDAEVGPSILVAPLDKGFVHTNQKAGSKRSSPKTEPLDVGVENPTPLAIKKSMIAKNHDKEQLVAQTEDAAPIQSGLQQSTAIQPTSAPLGSNATQQPVNTTTVGPTTGLPNGVTPTPLSQTAAPAVPTTPVPVPAPVSVTPFVPPTGTTPASAQPAASGPSGTRSILAPTPTQPVHTPASEASTGATGQPNALPGTSQGAPGNKGFLINFNNVQINEYIRFISKITNKNFIFDESELQFNVTIVSEEPTTVDNIMAALLQELRIHGLSLIEQGNNLIIHSNKGVNSPGKVVTNGYPNNSDVETRVFFLTTLDPNRTVDLLRPLLSTQALIEPIEETSNLVITDIKANIVKVADLLRSLDSSTGGFEIGQYVVQNTIPEALIALAEQIMTPLKQSKTLVLVAHNPTNSIFIVASPLLVQQTITVLQNLDVSEGRTGLMNLRQESDLNGPEGGAEGPGVGGPAIGGTGTASGAVEGGGGAGGNVSGVAGAAAGQKLPPGAILLPNGSILLPDGTIIPAYERGNLNNQALSRPGKWTANLPLGHPKSTEFYIHKLHYRKGDQIEAALQRIAESLQQTGVNSDLVTSIKSIQWIEASNSLIFTGTHESLEKVKELIEELDIAMRQVYLEVLILDTTIDNSLKFSVDWGSNVGNATFGASENFLSAGSPLAPILAGNELGGPVALDASGLTTTAGFNLGVIGRNISHNGTVYNSIAALVQALYTDTTSDIVLNPKIIVEDNSPAEIFVGINAPFKTQSIANDLGNVLTNNYQYEDIGTRFKVTPFLGSDEIITLQIDTAITSVAGDAGVSSITGTAILVTADLVTGGITTLKSTTSTRIHVPDNYFVILSGMIQSQTVITKTQVPCLGSIPILGAPFSEKSNSDSRRNLMLFIRPHIVDREEEYDQITKRNQDMFREKSRIQNSWKYQIDGTLDWLNLDSISQRDVDCP